ncbi:MAG: hypothetical protein A2004_10495 [Spirochaetes bacterium GWC1_61_12]|nr:MAG: hypothetical protein A2004_10495 [Spirochaetes bacterium GWC1_61_12]OHD58725.1 MAG: hypothetical protein A2Y32_01645 [Spirochaetes bacterium GWF1_60_12]HBO39674.1 hypothetical protein [Spirochaetaceae bacterium]
MDIPVDQAITLLAIVGVVAPVRGTAPVSTAIDTAQYTGTISWAPADNPFAATTVYTANIVLTVKAGWALTGVAANSFTVAGVTATNAVNSGNVAAVFPTTGNGDYSSENIGTLKYVPVGSFDRDGATGNISTITTAYRMSQYEITRAQFAAMLTTDPGNTSYSSGTSDPVQMANWYHAIAFCNKLSIAKGLTPVYSVIVGGTPVNFTTLIYANIPTSGDADWNAATCGNGAGWPSSWTSPSKAG